MTIPNDPAKRAEIMAQYIADVERRNPGERAFSASDWPIANHSLEEARYGSLLGSGCEYTFYALETGKVLTLCQHSGSWPGASVSWVVGEPRWYEEAILRVALMLAKEDGDASAHQLREMTQRVLEEML